MARDILTSPWGRMGLALLVAVRMVTTTLPFAQVGDKKKNPENVQARADKPGPEGKQKIVVTVDIHPDFFVLATPVGNEELEDGALVIKVNAKEKLQNVL